MLLVSTDNGAHQFMPHHVAFREIYSRDSGNSFQGLQCLNHTRALVRWEIDLRYIPGDHALGMRTDAGQHHEHLLGRRVLGLIENDKGVI